MLTIYHLENSRSERIIWLAEELGLPYELKRYKRAETGFASPEYKALHPLGRAPFIRDGEVTLSESGAIIDYLLTRYGQGRLVPKPESADYPRYVQFLHFAEGTAMQHLVMALLLGMSGGAPPSFLDERIAQDFAFADEALSGGRYFAGEFSGADINMAFALKFARDFLKRDIGAYPNIPAYLAKIEARPAFKKAMSLA